MDAPPRRIESPCVRVCIVDGASSLCVGCWRTLEEIARWTRYTDTERGAITAALPARKRANRAAVKALKAQKR